MIKVHEIQRLDQCTFAPKINKRKSTTPRVMSADLRFDPVHQHNYLDLSPLKTANKLQPSGKHRDLTPPNLRPSHSIIEMQTQRSQRSLVSNKSGIERSKSIFQNLVVREFNDLIQDVKGELIYEDFEKLMIKHGFVEPDKLTLLRDVFKSLSKSEIQPV